MKPRIVAFTKDWGDVPTCTTHILRRLARELPVLWVESIGTRKPQLTSAGDWARLRGKLRRALGRARRPESNLRVLTPPLIPQARSVASRALNRRLFRWLAGRELRQMGGGPLEYWCFVPNAVDLLPVGGRAPAPGGGGAAASLVVYYCVDDWSAFHNLDGAWLAAKEAELLPRADVVFTPARPLEEKCRRAAGGRVHYAPHGVDYEAFARALAAETEIPADARALPKPIVGFYGNLHPWVDFGLIGRLAQRRPGWTFLLIGTVFGDAAQAARRPNVHFLGRREHRDLPAYCKAFDAAMIPYDTRQARMQSVNPVKTKELLAAGVPVAAADLPELRGYGADVMLCRTEEDWLAALERQIARRDRAEISRRMAGEDWSAKVAALRRAVEEARARR